jgi:hypothetical protein
LNAPESGICGPAAFGKVAASEAGRLAGAELPGKVTDPDCGMFAVGWPDEASGIWATAAEAQNTPRQMPISRFIANPRTPTAGNLAPDLCCSHPGKQNLLTTICQNNQHRLPDRPGKEGAMKARILVRVERDAALQALCTLDALGAALREQDARWPKRLKRQYKQARNELVRAIGRRAEIESQAAL